MRSALLAVVLLSAAGCSGAIWSELRYNEGQMPVASPSADGGVSSKGEVLERLGPPRTVLPQRRGDIFVYQVTDVDFTVLNVNSGIFTGVTAPIYARLTGRQFDELLYVFFDDKGAVRHVSVGRRLPRR